MANSLIITFDELIDDIGIDTYSVIVNGQTRTSDSNNVEGIYSTYIESNDVISISVETSVSGLLRVVNVIRRDYTTDDINGDNGIRDTFISSSSGTTGTTYVTTFTATTIATCYNYEYRVTITIDNNTLCQIVGTAVGTPVLPPILNTGLIIYANGYSFTGTTGGVNRWWLDSRGNYNGRAPNSNAASPPIWRVFDTGFFELNNYSISFSGVSGELSTPPSTGVSFTMGGWIQTVPTLFDTELYSSGMFRLYKNSSNCLQVSVQTSGGSIINATSPTVLNPSSNIWNYVICKWTPGNSLKLYLNGVLVATTITAVTALGNLNTWRVGPARYTNISDFQVYYIGLTDDQILFNFNQLKFYYGY
jgi:hypothetical protein